MAVAATWNKLAGLKRQLNLTWHIRYHAIGVYPNYNSMLHSDPQFQPRRNSFSGHLSVIDPLIVRVNQTLSFCRQY